MSETHRLSYVERCDCGDVVVGVTAGEECPGCGDVVYE